jgi:membrane protease YdiL (CAAX protease family)
LPALAAYRRPVISDKRWDTLSVMQLGALVAMTLGLAIGLSSLLGPLLGSRLKPEEVMLLTVVVSLLCVQGTVPIWVHQFLRRNFQTWGEAFGLMQRNYRQCVTLALLALVIALFGMGVLSYLTTTVLEVAADRTGWDWLKPQPQAIAELLKNDWPWWLLTLQAFTAIIVAPVGEELLFRGVLYGFIKQRGHPRLALWISAVVFAAVHGNAVGFLFFIFLSMILVALYEQTKNILTPILLHALFNAVNFTLIVTQPKWAEKLMDS